MSTEQQSVDEESSDTEADEESDIRAQHERAQASGEVFQGRPTVSDDAPDCYRPSQR